MSLKWNKSAWLIRMLVGSLLLTTVFASARARADFTTFFPADQVEEFKLDNGMLFLLMPHGETPVFSAYIRVKVGGIDEPKGMTGVAHVIEHMAFKGTSKWGTKNWEKEQVVLAKIEQVGQQLAALYSQGKTGEEFQVLKAKLDELYQEHQQWNDSEALTREFQKRGGLEMNATTSQDMTSYFISLPTSELKFWAEAESQRLFNPVFREFYRERDVVLEERRMRIVDSPGGAFYRRFLEESFQVSPYARPTIGTEHDLMTLTRTKAEEFFKAHYRPDRAVGALVGRFDVKKVKKILRKTFGKIPAPSSPPVAEKFKYDTPPVERISCRVDLTRPAQPRLAIAFHKPTLPHKADYAFDLISTILSEDRYSWLYRSLVQEKGLAVSATAYAGVPGSRLPNLFMIYATPRGGVTLERLQGAILNELSRLMSEELTEEELERARKHLVTSQVWRLETNGSLAADLSYYQTVAGDWRYLVDYANKIQEITPADIQAVVAKYLTPGNRCFGFLHGETS